jgi:hypothetical protein
MITFVRTGHLQHILNPLLHKKYCTAMYSIMNIYILYVICKYILINIENKQISLSSSTEHKSASAACRNLPKVVDACLVPDAGLLDMSD